MRVVKGVGVTLVVMVVLVVVLVVAIGGKFFLDTRKVESQQTQLQPFYDLPDPLPDVAPGTLIRSEPMSDMDWQLDGAKAFRMLYMSEGPKGEPRVSSGMIFIPTAKSEKPRPVVAYAHGTAGFGRDCAPSRTSGTPGASPWVQTMMDNGWVLTATDYVGVGTTGTPFYLIGKSEAADVVNSARAAVNFPDSEAGSRYTVMGQSQGGHAALWAGHLSAKIAPELKLLGVSASAPAAELGPLVDESWNTANAWAIGPDMMVSWPEVYSDLNVEDVATDRGQEDYEEFAYFCVTRSVLEGELFFDFVGTLFSRNPNEVAGWEARIKQETPRPYPESIPVQVTAGTGDGLVFSSTQVSLQKKWCAAGSKLDFQWLGVLAKGFEAGIVAHGNTVLFGWPEMTGWMQERFQGKKATSNCGTSPPTLPQKSEPQSDS